MTEVTNPTELRMASENEFAANDNWKPGGYTSGGLPEAVIDLPSTTECNLIKIK